MAYQGTPCMCGVDGILFLEENNYVSMKHAVGKGTNNRVEFYVLWLLLQCVINRRINRLLVIGDSKLLMDWGKWQMSSCEFLV